MVLKKSRGLRNYETDFCDLMCKVQAGSSLVRICGLSLNGANNVRHLHDVHLNPVALSHYSARTKIDCRSEGGGYERRGASNLANQNKFQRYLITNNYLKK